VIHYGCKVITIVRPVTGTRSIISILAYYMDIFIFNSIILTSIFLLISNWFQLISFLSLVVGPKYKTSTVDDTWIKAVVKKKTGLSLFDITIFHDKKMYGMMAGLPFWPKMILSEGVYKSFNKDELEWVILHEAAHCVLWHNLQALLLEAGLIALGIYTTYLFNLPILFAIPYSIFLSLICIQIIRWGIEYVADRYSINRVDNPMGVITAQDKFRKGYSNNPFQSESSMLRFLLHWNIYPSRRIIMAKQRIKSLSSKRP
jgi:Zn-dependent protease with chaperone function